ncbi:MAG: tetratricopeptide repeat protein, partial [Chloroflexi bacterium]|nr:tetratricopeptide repeat protein [Chloroflexota bacterium]
AASIDALLTGTQQIKILITSRTRLRLYHEHSFPIHPLSLTERSRTPITVEQALHSNAVKLFVRRAQMVQPEFTLDPGNAAAVAEICERLDGMPLAIELAAARTRLLPPAALLRRLHDRLALLTTTIADLPERHQTLRATLDWSYNLLSPAEQDVFMRLAIFPSGCTLDAIEQVVATPEATPSLEIVESLLDKSLLNQNSRNGEPWLSMLETVYAYAMERLTESGQVAQVWERCARYYVAQIEALEDELSGPQQEQYLAGLAREHDNLRAILTWLLERSARQPSDVEAALRLCGVLWRFWWVRGYLYEGRHWMQRALAVAQPVPPEIRAKALRGAGVLARAQGDLESAELYLTESLALWRELQSPSGMALALNSLGVLLFNQRAYERAEPFFEESRLLHQALGDQQRVAIALNNLGNIAFKQGNLEQAAERYSASLQLLRDDHASRQTVALIQTNLAEIARLRENYVGATSILYESATIYWELNEVEGLLFCLNNLAEIALDRRHGELAARLLGVTDALYEQIGAVRPPDLAIDYARQINAVRSLIPDQVFAEHQRQGRSTTIDRMLADTVAIITA